MRRSTTSPSWSSVRLSELYRRKRHGLVGDQLQIVAIEFERRAFFGAARSQADGAIASRIRGRCSRRAEDRRAPAEPAPVERT